MHLIRSGGGAIVESFKISNPLTRDSVLKAASLVRECAAEDDVLGAKRLVATECIQDRRLEGLRLHCPSCASKMSQREDRVLVHCGEKEDALRSTYEDRRLARESASPALNVFVAWRVVAEIWINRHYIMKISERKHRLRRRGIVPMTDVNQIVPATTGTVSARRGGGTPPRPRWQPSPRYQIIFGLVYVVISPFLLIQSLAVAHSAKIHAGSGETLLQFAGPVVFFLFGVWWLWRGLRATRLARQTGGTLGATNGGLLSPRTPSTRPSRPARGSGSVKG